KDYESIHEEKYEPIYKKEHKPMHEKDHEPIYEKEYKPELQLDEYEVSKLLQIQKSNSSNSTHIR
ncbi:8168_t:CDS:1, partial [Cetraspora pellucida]